MGQVPLMVACSAYIDDETRKKCLKIGFNVILESPLSVAKINTEILKHLRLDKKYSLALESNISKRQKQLNEN